MNRHNSFAAYIIGIAALVLFFCTVVPVAAAENDVPLRAHEELLQDKSLEFWQLINEARRDPLAAAVRLNIPEETVRAIFSDQPWILEQGLSPLAWNATLRDAADMHGQDMFSRHYYSHVTPEGITYDQRVAAAGYEAIYLGETLNALFFNAHVDIHDALVRLADAMLVDELTGNTAVQRNIFNPNLTEVGASFFAMVGGLLGQQHYHYVYLMVVEFGAPLEPRRFLIGNLDKQSRPALKPFIEGGWRYLPVLQPGVFQVPYPDGGASLVVVTENGMGTVSEPQLLYDDYRPGHHYVDLRTVYHLEGELN